MSDAPQTPSQKIPDSNLERTHLPVDALVPNHLNPNEMSTRQFNMLVENMETVGFTEPVVCRPVQLIAGEPQDGEPQKYEIISGHHRWEAAKILGYKQVPVVINRDPGFDADKSNFQLMRHNMIKGKLSTEKFVKLYESMATKYSKEMLSEAFGFEEQAALEKLIKQTAKSLPKEMQSKFKEAAAEIKTIQDLSKLLNSLFTKYGDTLPYGYMLLDFGGRDSVWVRLHPSDRKNFEIMAARCVEAGKSVDGAVRILLQLIADKTCPQFESSLPLLPNVKVPEGKLPLEDQIIEGQEG